MKEMQLQVGDKVTYKTKYKKERGIVKSISPCLFFAVYNCNQDWENYANYTAQGTRPQDLVKGWECEYCNEIKEDTDYTTNPLEEEIHGDDSLHYICDECYKGFRYEI